jgi:hypothetical protein
MPETAWYAKSGGRAANVARGVETMPGLAAEAVCASSELRKHHGRDSDQRIDDREHGKYVPAAPPFKRIG